MILNELSTSFLLRQITKRGLLAIIRKYFFTIENVKLSDKVRSETILKKHNFLLVNQTMAQIKFTEMWKTTNTPNVPLNITQRSIPENGSITRSDTLGNYHNEGKSNLSKTQK